MKLIIVTVAVGLLSFLVPGVPAPPQPAADTLAMSAFCLCYLPKKGTNFANKVTANQNIKCCREQHEKKMGEKIALTNGTNEFSYLCLFKIIDTTNEEAVPTFKKCCAAKEELKGLCVLTGGKKLEESMAQEKAAKDAAAKKG